MATNTEFLDAVFGGTKAVLNTAQNVAGAFAQGVNDVNNIMDNSRRNQMGPQYTNGYGNGVNMPVTYPYPYSDTPTYGNMMMPMNSEPDFYPGFTDPGYGVVGGNVPNTSSSNFYNPQSNPNRPVGGAWY